MIRMRTNGCAAVCSIRAAGSHNSLQNIWRFAPFFFILQTIMILVFGGTTEGRKAVQVLEEAGTTYYYSTRGSAQEVEMVHGQRLQGAMEVADITKFCRDGGIRLLVDAAHPFAVNVHRNILSAAEELQIPVVRYERQYVPHTDDITWCDDYDDAVTSLRQAGITRLLALTGVQTIGKLKAYWQGDAQGNSNHAEKEDAEAACWFRILKRDDSQRIAREQGFPEDHLVYYEEDNTSALIAQLHPQAILTKESGKSGGFEEKVRAAQAAGVQVFVVCRPPFSSLFPPTSSSGTVPAPPSLSLASRLYFANGPHGLRRQIEQLLPEFFPMKTGLTTGTCATAAATAALGYILNKGNATDKLVSVRLPNGEDIEVKVESVVENEGGVTATVVKDAGDDPDVTDGLAVCATVSMLRAAGEGGETICKGNVDADGYEAASGIDIIIKGGEGVGVVTLPGLGLPIGAPAINETPQRMIRENLLLALSTAANHGGSSAACLSMQPSIHENTRIEVTISVPDGRETGEHTFNPRIGVVGGISIIGTSGIVQPFSSDAWISSIRKEMSVGYALTSRLSPQENVQIVINSGAKSEKFLRARYPHLPEQAFVHYGNFIGETLRIAAELGVKHLAMGVMIGKAVKLAEGNMDTHSHKVTMNRDFILQMLCEARISPSSLRGFSHSAPSASDESQSHPLAMLNMARELWDLVPPADMQRLARVIISHCHEHCAPLVPQAQIDVLLISEKGDLYS